MPYTGYDEQVMSFNGPATGAVFSPRRRTAAILIGEGTGAAYLAGVMKALHDAGVRVDVVLGKGAGALVAALSAIDADGQLGGDDGLLARVGKRRPWQLQPLYKVTLACLALSFAAFLSPVLVGLIALLMLPFAALARLVTESSAAGPAPTWFGYLLEAGEPLYLRAMVVPLIVLCAFWLLWWAYAFVRERRIPSLPELYELGSLSALLESSLWQAVRGASTDSRPHDRKELGEAYRKLLSGSWGQRGFRELVIYALDTDSGQEIPFAMLKERFFEKLEAGRAGRREWARAEPIDLGKDGDALFFDALMAALSPPGLVPSVPMKLPLGTKNGGEVHRFSSSLLASGGAVADAVSAGAEQIIFVAGCTPGEQPSGNPLERVTEAATRTALAVDLAEAANATDLPVFLIRPDKQRLSPYEITGRAQFGNERLDLAALMAHGERDAERLFIEPVLGDARAGSNEATVPINEARGPREL